MKKLATFVLISFFALPVTASDTTRGRDRETGSIASAVKIAKTAIKRLFGPVAGLGDFPTIPKP